MNDCFQLFPYEDSLLKPATHIIQCQESSLCFWKHYRSK